MYQVNNIQVSRYHVGDAVYAQDRGPYLVAKVLGRGQYSLCHHNGAMAEGGKGINENNIKKGRINVGDKVYARILDAIGNLQRRGPYFIAQVLLGGKYILCHPNGAPAEDGKAIDEKCLFPA